MGLFIKYYFSNPALVLGLISVIAFCYYWRTLDKIIKLVGVLVSICFLFDTIARWLSFNHMHNQWLYNIAINLEIPLQFFIFYKVIYGQERAYIKFVGCGLFILSLINIAFIQGFNVLNTYTYIPSLFAISLCSFFYLKQVLSERDDNPYNNFFVWFAIGSLIDSAASIPIISLYSWFAYIYKEIVYEINIINKSIYSIWFLAIIIGLVWTNKQRKLPLL